LNSPTPLDTKDAPQVLYLPVHVLLRQAGTVHSVASSSFKSPIPPTHHNKTAPQTPSIPVNIVCKANKRSSQRNLVSLHSSPTSHDATQAELTPSYLPAVTLLQASQCSAQRSLISLQQPGQLGQTGTALLHAAAADAQTLATLAGCSAAAIQHASSTSPTIHTTTHKQQHKPTSSCSS
jgi:hypothetical protein